MRKKWEDMGKKERADYDIAMRQLYGKSRWSAENEGKASLEAVQKPETSRKACLAPTEHQEQVKVVTYLRKANVLFYAVPNEAKRSMRLGAWMKAQGMQPGIPDLCIPIARGGYHGLFLELKRLKGGVVSESQKFWIDALTKEGYFAVVCKGADAAIDEIQKYLKG